MKVEAWRDRGDGGGGRGGVASSAAALPVCFGHVGGESGGLMSWCGGVGGGNRGDCGDDDGGGGC